MTHRMSNWTALWLPLICAFAVAAAGEQNALSRITLEAPNGLAIDARGDLGASIYSGLPVTTLIGQRAEATISLTLLAMLISIVVGVPIGVLAAGRRGSGLDRGVMIFAVSGFYKRFQNPIERVIQTSVGNNSMSIQNVDRADVYGIEVEGRRRLATTGSLLSRFVVGANATLVRSQVRIPEEEMVVIRAADPAASETRSLDGQ